MAQSKVVITFNGPDGSVWAIPGEVVAHDRAKHYADEGPTAYADEFAYAIGDHRELLDWMRNNMNPEDYAAYATKVKQSDPLTFVAVAWHDDTQLGITGPEVFSIESPVFTEQPA